MLKLLVALIISLAVVAASAVFIPDLSINSFKNQRIASSAGGKAICILGDIPVRVSAPSTQLKLDNPSSQFALTEIIVQLLQVNTTFPSSVIGPSTNINGTYNIHSKICFPTSWSTNSTKPIQFLIHGLVWDKSYWDVAPGYSYIDAAAEAGYPTFSYDRLGVGESDRPDPIQVVQGAIQVEIAHFLVQSLRTGAVAGYKFKHVVGVGHSFGSIQMNSLTVNYPKDLDSIALTGFSIAAGANPTVSELFLAAFDIAIASENDPARFSGIPSGYLVTHNIISNQFAFGTYPNFDTKLFAETDRNKQTFTLGELLTSNQLVKPAITFTGSVDIVLGEFDAAFCQANCRVPIDQAANALHLYPAANNGSQSVILPGVGHGINVHYDAPKAFSQTLAFFKSNGF